MVESSAWEVEAVSSQTKEGCYQVDFWRPRVTQGRSERLWAFEGRLWVLEGRKRPKGFRFPLTFGPVSGRLSTSQFALSASCLL
jgi:hypothetical protein